MSSKPVTREVRADLSPEDWLYFEKMAMESGKPNGRALATHLLSSWVAQARRRESSEVGGGAPAGAGIGRSGSADA